VAVEEVVLAGPLPDEVPRVVLVPAQNAAALAVGRLELAGVRAGDVAVAEGHVVGVLARLARHEADAIGAAVGRVAEALDGRYVAALAPELPGDRHVGERIL